MSQSAASRTSATAANANATERRLAEVMEKLLAQPPASPPAAEYRARDVASPRPPMTLREMYDARFEVIKSPKWREQLLDRPAHKRSSDTDLAEMVLALEEGTLATMLAFDGSTSTCYLSDEMTGVWRRTVGPKYHDAHNALILLTERMDRAVIEPLKALIRRLHGELKRRLAEGGVAATPAELERLQGDRMECEEHLRDLVNLYEKLRKVSQQETIVTRIITLRMAGTRDEGVTEAHLDVAKDCIAFNDGVFCFVEERLLTGEAARRKYQTMTVGYRFEELRAAVVGEAEAEEEEEAGDARRLPGREAMPETARREASEYEAFMARIHSSTPEVGPYLMDNLASSLLNENRQVLMIHHNKKGANGKSTKFALIKATLGDLLIKCSSSLIAASASSSPSGPNEELMSTRGKRLVLFAEPNVKIKLSSSVIKELTGGDEQSARANYGKKQNFVLSCTVHVLCNKIPETDDMDGGGGRRLRCVPYGSTFVYEVPEPAQPHVYKREVVEGSFGRWRYFMMFEMMTAAIVRVRARALGRLEVVPAPDVVMTATRRLIEREDALAGFVANRLVRTGVSKDFFSLKMAHEAYNDYCYRVRKPAELTKADLNQHLLEVIGPHTRKHGNLINWWRGWSIVYDEEDDDEGEDGAFRPVDAEPPLDG